MDTIVIITAQLLIKIYINRIVTYKKYDNNLRPFLSVMRWRVMNVMSGFPVCIFFAL